VPRTAKSQIGFADRELLRQGLSLEPFLQTISDFLEDHEEMINTLAKFCCTDFKLASGGLSGQSSNL
jgi:hypothetical protein